MGNYRKHKDDDDLTQSASDRRYERVMSHYYESDHEEDTMRGRSWEANEGIRDELPNSRPKAPQGSSPRVTVSIPVQRGSYSGQRGEWVGGTVDMGVALEGGDLVVLTAHDQSVVKFPKSGLDAALKILEDYHA